MTNITIDRRSLMTGAAALTAGVVAAPSIARAQAKKLKIAVMLPRSGFFAQAASIVGADPGPAAVADVASVNELRQKVLAALKGTR